MPQIVNYLACARAGRTYDDRELATLQRVYDAAREALCMSADDPRREVLAGLIFSMSEYDEVQDSLADRVIAAFRALR